jgi:hypothetical protein
VIILASYKAAHTLDLPPAAPQTLVLTITMLPSKTNHPIPPTHSQSLIPDLSAMTLWCHQSAFQLQSIPGPFLSPHIHSAPAPAFPLPHHAKPPPPEPSAAGLTMHRHGHHVLQPSLGHRPWQSTVPHTLQIFGPEVQVPNIQAREATAAVKEHK